MKIFKIAFVLIGIILFSCSKETVLETKILSPDSSVEIAFNLTDDGQPTYKIIVNNEEVIKNSSLGFDLKNQSSLNNNFKLINSNVSSFSEVWEMPWGEQIEVENNYNELKIELQEITDLKRKLNIVFKAYDDGVGFRYEFPEQENLSEVYITNENTQFNLTDNHKVWWIPGDWDIYEHLYSTTLFSEIDAKEKAIIMI